MNKFYSNSQFPFFKSPQSPFPSGYSTLENLQKNQISKSAKPEIKYLWNKNILSYDDIKPVRPAHLSKFVFDKQNRERWEVLEVSTHQIKLKNLKSSRRLLLDIDEVLADPYDLGYALSLKEIFLHQTNESETKAITKIPQGSLLKTIRFDHNQVKVQFKNLVGFVPISEVLSKFDFCTMIYANNKWSFLKKREFDSIITSDNQRINLNQIERLLTPDAKGIIASNKQKIPLWSQVEVIQTSQADWMQSQLKGHGLIWWRQNKNNSQTQSENDVTIDQLIREPISSVSFHPKNPLKGVLSSNGVYLTEDGLHWKKINKFENFNGPVHYFNDLLIFVGNYRSLDGGQSFENYIQIEKLTQAIEDQYGFLPRKLQVKNIEVKSPYRIKLEIETGFRKIKMESPLFAQAWKAVKI